MVRFVNLTAIIILQWTNNGAQQVNINLSFDWLSESPSKTATGTIAIQVKDFNDNCPKLVATTHTMCLEDNVIYITAVDEDEFPNSAPFDFTVIQGNRKEKWKVEPFNGTIIISKCRLCALQYLHLRGIFTQIHYSALVFNTKDSQANCDLSMLHFLFTLASDGTNLYE